MEGKKNNGSARNSIEIDWMRWKCYSLLLLDEQAMVKRRWIEWSDWSLPDNQLVACASKQNKPNRKERWSGSVGEQQVNRTCARSRWSPMAASFTYSKIGRHFYWIRSPKKSSKICSWSWSNSLGFSSPRTEKSISFSPCCLPEFFFDSITDHWNWPVLLFLSRSLSRLVLALSIAVRCIEPLLSKVEPLPIEMQIESPIEIVLRIFLLNKFFQMIEENPQWSTEFRSGISWRRGRWWSIRTAMWFWQLCLAFGQSLENWRWSIDLRVILSLDDSKDRFRYATQSCTSTFSSRLRKICLGGRKNTTNDE